MSSSKRMKVNTKCCIRKINFNSYYLFYLTDPSLNLRILNVNMHGTKVKFTSFAF